MIVFIYLLQKAFAKKKNKKKKMLLWTAVLVYVHPFQLCTQEDFADEDSQIVSVLVSVDFIIVLKAVILTTLVWNYAPLKSVRFHCQGNIVRRIGSWLRV